MIKEDHDEESNQAAVVEQLLKDPPGASEALASLEKNLPVELSFLIRQQAYIMARMNYLNRQFRELKEQTRSTPNSGQSNPVTVAPTNYHSSSNSNSNSNSTWRSPNLKNQHPNQHHHHHHPHQHQKHSSQHQQIHTNNIISQQANYHQQHHTSGVGQLTTATSSPATNGINQKNGNFIHSDDSGGEFSRATISDDDELSSLLDQIAKSVRPSQPDRNHMMHANMSSTPIVASNNIHYNPAHHPQYLTNNKQTHQLHSSQFAKTQHQQPYTIIDPSQLHPHHQTTTAVPVFVMSSPIAVAHPSSISSTVLPGVHFQPEPRYNQYYEDLYIHQGSPSTSTLYRPHHQYLQTQPVSTRSNQTQQAGHFDTSISAVEQLMSQKEKKHIKTQLKCADNWLKMRTANGALGHLSLSNNFGLATSAGQGVEPNSDEATSNMTGIGGQSSAEDANSSQKNPTSTNSNVKASCMIEDS